MIRRLGDRFHCIVPARGAAIWPDTPILIRPVCRLCATPIRHYLGTTPAESLASQPICKRNTHSDRHRLCLLIRLYLCARLNRPNPHRPTPPCVFAPMKAVTPMQPTHVV